MLNTLQSFVRRYFSILLLTMIGLGFLLIVAELLLYNHYQGVQLVGLIAAILGTIVAFAGIWASGKLRLSLAIVFVILAISGIIGTIEHNEDRLGGERGGPPQSQQQPANASGESEPNATGSEGGQDRPAPGEFPGGSRTEPPPLAPLSLSGFCVLGALVLLGTKRTTDTTA